MCPNVILGLGTQALDFNTRGHENESMLVRTPLLGQRLVWAAP